MIDGGSRLLWIGTLLEVIGLLTAIIAIVWFHRLTMLLLFAVGMPLVAAGILCYAIVVTRYLIYKGAL